MGLIRTLLVDDSADFLDSAEQFLSADHNIEVIGRSQSGPEAIDEVSRLRPDLVLMDLAMPGMNGLEATQAIKAIDSPPRVIILTLYDNPEYRAAAGHVGADAFLTKSDFGERLLALIHDLQVTAGADGVTNEGIMKDILVVDDSATMRRMVKACLSSLPGTRFLEANSGLQAIEQLILVPISLIVLDLNMPDMHGLEVLEFVKGHQSYRHIPVVVLTTRGDEASRTAVQAAGASAYLTKPFQPAELSRQVSELLQD
jgi:two-component system, chemotaxis family, chemotaxis protein CheY